MKFLIRIVALGALAVAGLHGLDAQGMAGKRNLPAFDTKPYHFGFLLSGNRADFRFDRASDAVWTDSLLGIANVPQAGFNLALLASWNINRFVSVRFVPGLSFQDRGLEYRFLAEDDIETTLKRTESVYLDFPLLLKLRTARVGNFAAYGLIGGTLSRDMQSQSDVNQQLQDDFILRLERGNRSLDVGAGTDFFLPFFKFSVEGKFQLGTRNVLIQDESTYSSPLERLRTRTFILSFCFEG
jgi:hypothetical protein